ncbi:MAG TPA: TIM barrel protein [Gemmataceae bacterium]|nr:TIM barrel protein [Gemmataceae bacterium]
MHPLGVPSHLFRGSPAEAAAACRQHGLSCVQLTPGFPGLSFHEPGLFTPERCRRMSDPFREAGVAVACVAVQGNLMDPDLDRRHRNLLRLHALLRHARDFGTERVLVESGSLSPKSPWAPYPPNRSREAWVELRIILAEALRVAADHGATLLLKAEPSHVLATAEDCRRLRDELGSPCLGFIMDPACFLAECQPGELSEEMVWLFERLGRWAVVAHAKDLRFDKGGATLPRAGRGVLDYGLFVRLLGRWQPGAPIILEHLQPGEVDAAVAHVNRFVAQAAPGLI